MIREHEREASSGSYVSSNPGEPEMEAAIRRSAVRRILVIPECSTDPDSRGCCAAAGLYCPPNPDCPFYVNHWRGPPPTGVAQSKSACRVVANGTCIRVHGQSSTPHLSQTLHHLWPQLVQFRDAHQLHACHDLSLQYYTISPVMTSLRDSLLTALMTPFSPYAA